MRTQATLGLLFLLACAGSATAKDKPRPKPSPKQVHEAVQAASGWLRKQHAQAFDTTTFHSVPEIVALALHHAQVDRQDPVFRTALTTIETCELTHTYRVATMAMALSRINPFVYRARLAHCAQWLVDTQLAGGEWGYPGTMQGRAKRTKALQVDPPVTEEEAKGGPKAEPILIARKAAADAFAGQEGDFSNTQYAILGLRACMEARIEIPKETWETALAWTAAHQLEDGSFGYDHAGQRDEAGYASMTAAAACGIAMCQSSLGKSPKAHPAIKKALAWLDKRWTADDNAGIDESIFIPPSTWHCYHLYSVERAGRVLGVKKFAGLDWYAEGAWWLLDHQQGDGSWNDTRGDTTATRPPYLQTADTCFAILFLTLATPPLTGG
ncbi:MAG: terpene cyclase/mutase family protein [Planctomycetota bacterium]|nr:terpene cyclase/mutase family protein [Planctomycetota bacterium]